MKTKFQHFLSFLLHLEDGEKILILINPKLISNLFRNKNLKIWSRLKDSILQFWAQWFVKKEIYCCPPLLSGIARLPKWRGIKLGAYLVKR